MEYLTSKEMSELWEISQRRIIKLASEGRIEGAVHFGKSWMIPKNATKPIDKRTKEGKNISEDDFFRFPLYINMPLDSFVPPLTKEEELLKKAQEDFFACRFEEAENAFLKLSKCASNKTVRICAVMFMAVLSSVYDSDIDWVKYYKELNLYIADVKDHKEEISILLPWLQYFCGLFQSISSNVSFNPEYDYSPNANFLNAFLSIFTLYTQYVEDNNLKLNLKTHEILCKTMEEEGYILQSQQLHYILFIAYYIFHEESLMLYHLRKVFSIALKYDLIYEAADITTYYEDAVLKIKDEFPEDFVNSVSKYSEKLYQNYASFASKNNFTDIYSCLTPNEYSFILYVLKGYTNKEIAKIVNFSTQTVSNKLSEIYAKLNINSRHELIALLKESMRL